MSFLLHAISDPDARKNKVRKSAQFDACHFCRTI
jgi:hypothetical protein